jgi:hypothetical protein
MSARAPGPGHGLGRRELLVGGVLDRDGIIGAGVRPCYRGNIFFVRWLLLLLLLV